MSGLKALRWSRDQVLRTVVAVLAGIAIGISAAIVLGQQGSLAPWAIVRMAVTTAVVVAVMGTVPWPRRVARGLAVGAWTLTLVVLGFGFAAPAGAQEAGCSVRVQVDDEPAELLGETSRDRPLVLPLDRIDGLRVEARAAGLPDPVVQVVLVEIEPEIPTVLEGGLLLWTDQLRDGEASTTLTVEEDATTFVLVGAREERFPMPPLGQARFAVSSRIEGRAVATCLDGEAWIRFVATPASNGFGRAAMISLVLGTGLLHLALRAGGRDAPAPPPSGEPVPARGNWHVPRVETQLVDAAGQPVNPDVPLVPGATYQLHVALDSPLGARPTVGGDAVQVVGDHDGVPFEATWSEAGTASVPLTVGKAGVATTAIDVMFRGHLLQTERLELVVGEPAPGGVAGQTTRTVFSASDLSLADLEDREPRALLLVVEPAGNGAVWARVNTPDGQQLPLREDGPNRPVPLAAVNEAVGRAREALHAEIEDDESTDRLLLRRDLAATGRRLHRALLATTPRSVELLRQHVTDGVVVQVVQDGAGMGWGTVPWQLLYDLPLDAGAPELVPCPHEPHAVDACPSTLEDGVVCTTGFWGVRAVIEEPAATSASDVAAHDGQRPRVVATTVTGEAGAHVARELVGAEESLAEVRALGFELLEDRAQLLAALADPGTGLVYAYGHHGIAAPTGEEGFQLGDSWLLPDDLFDRGLEAAGRPIVVLNGCRTGAGELTSLNTLPDALLWAGCAAVVASETTLYAPTAGRHGKALLRDLLAGEPLGPSLLRLRRRILADEGMLSGLSYRLHGSSETRVVPAIDLAGLERDAAAPEPVLAVPDADDRVDLRPPEVSS